MSEPAAIELSNVSFSYGHAPVLTNASFVVGPRELVSIVGPNGGGKTTLLRLILGLEHAASGEVRVLGTTPMRARGNVGYMPQHVRFDPLFPITALDVVLMGRISRGKLWYTRADRRVARESLEKLGVEDAAGRRFAELSGGQRQRVLIARALATRPQLMLLDEPMNMVDIAAADSLVQTLKEINNTCAVVLVSHDLGFVSQIVDSVVCVNRTVAHHPTSQLTGDLVKELYGSDVRMIRHDHRCSEEGHSHG